MEPIAVTIATALAAGAIAAAKDVATNAIKDAYAGLKRIILDRYREAGPFIKAVEQDPTSVAAQTVLAEQLQKTEDDPKLKESALALLHALDAIRNDVRAQAVLDFGKLHAAKNFQLKDIEFSGSLVRADEAVIDGDFTLENLRQRPLKESSGN